MLDEWRSWFQSYFTDSPTPADSPYGGAGAGCARAPQSPGDAWAWAPLPHPDSPAGRRASWQFEFSRLESVNLLALDKDKPPRVYTREDASRLIDDSEDQIVDISRPDLTGHAQIHVGTKDTPALDLPGRRKLTTMYRSRTQAEKDLREVLNKHSKEIEDLPAGESLEFLEPVKEPRQVFVAEPYKPMPDAATAVRTMTKSMVYVKLIKTQDGSLHLRTMYLKT